GSRILGPQNQAGSCFGDSGGPLLHHQNGVWTTTGATHAGGSAGNRILSLYSNLNRTENRAFLEAIDAQYGLQLFTGCWTSPDVHACGPSEASGHFLGFLKPWFQRLFAWVWPF
ncbi:MAG: trypsin-like serine protease, partial [Anaerolineae bacterium]|nr:trypsin-like serine protease [Anaerolineae bacterium]